MLGSLSPPSSGTHLTLPAAEGVGLGTAAAEGPAGPGQQKPEHTPERKSRAQGGLNSPPTSRPRRPHLPRLRPPRARRPSAPAPARGVTSRLRAADGGRSEQGGSSGRKGRCLAARPREGECGARCAPRPGVGAAVRPPPGVSPAVRGAPWRLAGGSRGGCGWIGGGVDVVGPAGRPGRDCALFPYVSKALQTVLSGSRGLVSGSRREGDRARRLFHVHELRLPGEQQTPPSAGETHLHDIKQGSD